LTLASISAGIEHVENRFLSLARETFDAGKSRELKPEDLDALMGRPVQVRDAYEQHTLKLRFDAVGMAVTFHRNGKVTVFPPSDDSLLRDPPAQTAKANAPTAPRAVTESNPRGPTLDPAAPRAAAPKGTGASRAGASTASNTTRPATPRRTAGSSPAPPKPAPPKAAPKTPPPAVAAPAAPRAATTGGQRPAGPTPRVALPPTGMQSYTVKRLGWLVVAVVAVFILYVAVKSLEGGPNRPPASEVREACAGAGAAAEAAITRIHDEGATKLALGMLAGIGIAECPSLE